MSIIADQTVDTPTIAQYTNLQLAYDFFNENLFDNKLAPCIIVFGRDIKRCYGYFHAEQWQHVESKLRTHTISLTPMHLDRPLQEIFGTLVHEMVHLWQHDHGENKSKNGYHNKEWAEKMKEIGLYPSSTGQEGGKETGPKVSHYIIGGGPFDNCFQNMPEDIKLHWIGAADQEKKKKPKREKTTYQCPGCEAKIWGKPDLRVQCLECEEIFETL